jgi:hypothetical protein
MSLACGLVGRVALSAEAAHDTVQAALGNTLVVFEPSGTEVRMRFKADHRYELEYLDPQGKGAYEVVGKQVCRRTAGPDGKRECHATVGRWWVDGDKLCQMPDGSPSDFNDCHPLDRGRKLGDSWTQPAGPNATMKFELRAGK